MQDKFGRDIGCRYMPGRIIYTSSDGIISEFSDDVDEVSVINFFNKNIPTSGEFLSKYAKQLLDNSDVAILRCLEKSIIIPQEWKNYRSELRQIVSLGSGDIPEIPDYASGT